MSHIPLEVINHLWPNGDSKVPGLRQAIADGDHWLEHFGLDSRLVVTHLMAQISHECGAGVTMEENLNYRADTLRAQWPSHFTAAQAEQMAHHPQLIANQAYNGRMGNRPGTNDGYDYRGRGGTQTTGRETYSKLGKQAGLDLLSHPEMVNDPQYFMQIVCADFVMCGCLPYAKANNIIMVTRRLNGGAIGLDSRRAWFTKWDSSLSRG